MAGIEEHEDRDSSHTRWLESLIKTVTIDRKNKDNLRCIKNIRQWKAASILRGNTEKYMEYTKRKNANGCLAISGSG